MIDSLTSENYRDFGPRYAGTYGWLVKSNEDKRLVYFNKVEDDRGYFTINGHEYHVNVNANVKFEFIQVDHGWFNANDGNSYLLSRTPSRMWKRGISEQNTQIFQLSHNNLLPTRLNEEKLISIFNNEFATRNYPSRWQTGALSKHFAVSITNQLYFYAQQIGTILDNKIILLSNLVEQEIRDLVQRKGATFTVEVANDND